MPSKLEHLVGSGCPEQPNRMENLLENQPLLRKALEELDQDNKVDYAELAPDGEKFLTLFHTQDYINEVREGCAGLKPRETIAFDQVGDTWISQGSYPAACYAAGAAVRAAELARTGKKAFAIIRPPGHHAHSDHAGGFCLFNNIAIASEYLRLLNEKVMIIDIDLHLGDGTVAYVSGKEWVSYFSLHHSGLWPATEFSDSNLPDNVNFVTLPNGTDETYYIKALNDTLCHAIRQFSAETKGKGILAVSAGFDTHQDDYKYSDLKGGFQLTERSYRIFKKILDESSLPYFLVLEGGYRPESLDAGVSVFTEELTQREKSKNIPLVLNPRGCFYACDG